MRLLLSILLLNAALFSENVKSDLEYQLEIEKLRNEILRLEKKLLEEQLKSNVKTKEKSKVKNKRKTPDPNFIHNIEIGNSVVLGNPKAPITLTKFTDFQWPFCARSVSLIDEVLEKYPNDVKVVIKNFPLGSHKQARKAAQYALAAHKQGKYKDMYRKIFDNYKQLKSNEDLPLTYAAELGLDIRKLNKDMADKSISDLIDWEYNQLVELRNAYPETEQYAAGVRLAVPKFFINGREPLSRSIDGFSIIIEEELKK